jgi:hypothetical protein
MQVAKLTQDKGNRCEDDKRWSPSPRPCRTIHHLFPRTTLRSPRRAEAPARNPDRHPSDLVRDADEVLQPAPELSRPDEGRPDAQERDRRGGEQGIDRHAALGRASEYGGCQTTRETVRYVRHEDDESG